MKNLLALTVVFILLHSCFHPLSTAHAQGTAFTYQGRLNDSNGPVTGTYDLVFGLYGTDTGGMPVGSGILTNSAVSISNGLFTVTLDFGYGVFDGSQRYLEISVQPTGGTNFNVLTPRQAVTPAPSALFASKAMMTSTANYANTASMAMNANYAMMANMATTASTVLASGVTGTLADSKLSANVALLNATNQTFAGAVMVTNPANQFAGTFVGDGSGLTNLTIPAASSVPASGIAAGTANISITGNAGTATTAAFAGTAAMAYTANAATTAVTAGTATNLIGNVPDALLSANIARLNGTNVFTGTNTFSNVLVATNPANQIAGVFTGSGAGLTNLSAISLANGSITADKFAAGVINDLGSMVGVPTNILLVNSNGLVGIGTTNPSAGLQITTGAPVTTASLLFEVQNGQAGYTNLFYANRPAVNGNLLAVSGSQGVTLVNIAYPGSPWLQSQIVAGSGAFTNIYGAAGLAWAGSNLVVAAQYSSAVTILSATNPAVPVKLAELRNGVGGWNNLYGAYAVAVSGNLLAIGAFNSGAVTLVDISNPAAPVQLISMVDGQYGFTNLAGVTSVALSGNLLTIGSGNDSAVTLVDVSNPSNPVKLAELQHGVGGYNLSGVQSVALAGNLLAISAWGSSAVTLVDVSNPANPVKLAELQHGVGGYNLAGVESVALAGNRLAIAAYGSSAVTLVDISNPSAPVLLTTVKDGVNGVHYLAGADGVAFDGTNLIATASADNAFTIFGFGMQSAGLASAGWVGIGTTLPVAPLDVVGNVVVENASLFDIHSTHVALGSGTTASGYYSTALGYYTTASGYDSTALGAGTTASGNNSTAMGYGTTASGEDSTAMGISTTASGYYSTAMGSQTTASGNYSTALGAGTTASGIASTALGAGTTASGLYSTAMGYGNIASGAGSAVGGGGLANWGYALSLNTASGTSATVPGGVGNTASGGYSTAMGYFTTASGIASTAIGDSTKATGNDSTALGYQTTASGFRSTAVGDGATASGDSSIAMGLATTASGSESTAMGLQTVASGTTSTAMGAHTTAVGDNSTAMGYATTASGDDSTAMGYYAGALHKGSFVWADASSPSAFNSTATNQFLIRAQSGVGIGLTNPSAQLHISSSGGDSTPQVCVNQENSSDYARLRFTRTNDYNRRWDMAVTTNRFVIYSGQYGSEMLVLDSAGLTVRGTLASSSDRNLKENFQPVDAQAVLSKVAALPLTRWNYKEDKAQQHVGPMAQDFYAAFAVGPDDKHITTVDESGVAFPRNWPRTSLRPETGARRAPSD